MSAERDDNKLLRNLLAIYDERILLSLLNSTSPGAWTESVFERLMSKDGSDVKLTRAEFSQLSRLLPVPPLHHPHYDFDFIDLLAGVGGMRQAFESVGGRCVLTCERNVYARRMYRANFCCEHHPFYDDIQSLSVAHVPDHDVLLAHLPLPIFRSSLAGVSRAVQDKPAPSGAAAGPFFDVLRILAEKRAPFAVLLAPRGIANYDQGRGLKVALDVLSDLGYWVSDSDAVSDLVISCEHFVPQHKAYVVLVCFRRDLNLHTGFSLRDIRQFFPSRRPVLADILEPEVDEKYVLSLRSWRYLHEYGRRNKGSGFEYRLVTGDNVALALSSHYAQNPSSILIDRGYAPALDIDHPHNLAHRPRRLTPRECARMMGFDAPQASGFRIPVGDSQAYKLFGASAVVPAISAVAKLMRDRICAAKNSNENIDAPDRPPATIQSIFQRPADLDAVFCKIITTNDDSGRHGVLIPGAVYEMFPQIEGFDPEAAQNYTESIVTIWQDVGRIIEKKSSYKHYHRYPERRITALGSKKLDLAPRGTAILIGRHRADHRRFEVHVIYPDEPTYAAIVQECRFAPPLQGAYFFDSKWRAGEIKSVSSALSELLGKFDSVAGRYVRTLRPGDTGVGYTFEALVDISENNDRTADFKGIEIKTFRSKELKLDSQEKTDYFLQAPIWIDGLPKHAERVRLYGYVDENGRPALYSAVRCKENVHGFRLAAAVEEQRVYLEWKGRRVAYYSFEVLEKRLTEKHTETVFIAAASRGRGKDEEFCYESLLYCRSPSINAFVDLIPSGDIVLEIRMHLKPDGIVRDHGFAFRVFRSKLPSLYSEVICLRDRVSQAKQM